MLTRLVEMVSFILAKSLEFEDDDWGVLKNELTEQLEGKGFQNHEIDIAFEVVNRIRNRLEQGNHVHFPFKTNRVYPLLEELKISQEARGYLLNLMEQGVITPVQREEVIERAFFLEDSQVGLDEIEYLVSVVLGGEGWPGEDSPSMNYTLH